MMGVSGLSFPLAMLAGVSQRESQVQTMKHKEGFSSAITQLLEEAEDSGMRGLISGPSNVKNVAPVDDSAGEKTLA